MFPVFFLGGAPLIPKPGLPELFRQTFAARGRKVKNRPNAYRPDARKGRESFRICRGKCALRLF